ncbi:hypothetical protein F8388_001725 [Cannabis sativa]|uniref:SMP domain-containing protein n=1 Tax=Cannabis sativa TaxID=3483 RepID=A0A7J6HKW0_CANSA|nr:hypothetical protein G4B88_012838 [Cannabis sativa]KAF4395338.1 hypothetical protein F8388_001725 [Cannabis sativa]
MIHGIATLKTMIPSTYIRITFRLRQPLLFPHWWPPNILLTPIIRLTSEKLEKDKCVTREDAERVIDAEIRNKPDLNITPTPPGIGASMAAAATILNIYII